MFKKMLPVILILTLAYSIPGCIVEDTDNASGDKDAWKIGIMSNPATPKEEAYRMAQGMQHRYGEDRILHTTYPDRFMQDQETIVTNMMEMATDPLVKAIIIVEAVPGTSVAISKVRDIRPDLLIIVGLPQDDPYIIAAKADIVLDTADIIYADKLVDNAVAMGADVLVHYSFPRHTSVKTLSERNEAMQKRTEELGLIFINEVVPDSAGDTDLSGIQQLLTEDISLKIEQYGENIAFFSTSSVLTDLLTYQAVEYGIIVPGSSQPNPYTALPELYGIEVPEDKEDDLKWIIERIGEIVSEQGSSARFPSWPVAVNMLFVEAGVEYAFEWINGNITERVDQAKLLEIMKFIEGGSVSLIEYSGIENYWLYHADLISFSTRL